MSAVIIYGDISPNVIDGSSIWLMSIAQVCSAVFDEVHLQLKMPIEDGLLVGSLADYSNIHVHQPKAVHTVASIVPVLENLAGNIDADAIIARGMELCWALSSSAVAPKLWAYVTDLPFPLDKVSDNGQHRLESIASKSALMLAQTEAARSYLETLAPSAAGKTVLMRPMIPQNPATTRVWDYDGNRPLRLVYAGKLAKDWKTLEMLDIPRELRRRGINAELRVVGAKINRDPAESGWVAKMKAALENAHDDPTSGVTWVGAVSRDDSLREIHHADIGIGWRTLRLDSSLEISTKALEYSASGVPSLVNRNSDNLGFFGDTYGLFAPAEATPADAARIIDEFLRSEGWDNRTFQSAAGEYSMGAAVQRLRTYAERRGILNRIAKAPRSPVKVLIASHDFKFMGELVAALEAHPDFEVRLDPWDSLTQHSARRSEKLAAWADVIFCEWAGPSVKFFSERKPTGTALVTRLHGFELRNGTWLDGFDFDAVDRVVFVSEHYRRRAVAKLGINEDTTSVITNCLDALDLHRPKTPEARFTLGLLGIVPFLKRPDRALDLLERLLEQDERYVLRIKGRAPWEYPYEWKKPLTRQLYLDFYARIASSPRLRRAVIFEPFGPQVGNWLRGIGVILSPSDEESFHLAPAEAMASGAVPVVWEREGASEIFPAESVISATVHGVERILALRDLAAFNAASADAQIYAQRWGQEVIVERWLEMLAGSVRQSHAVVDGPGK